MKKLIFTALFFSLTITPTLVQAKPQIQRQNQVQRTRNSNTKGARFCRKVTPYLGLGIKPYQNFLSKACPRYGIGAVIDGRFDWWNK